jgi:hypothetical protein
MGTPTSKELRAELDRFAAAARELHGELKALVESDLVSEEWLLTEDGDYTLLALKKLYLAANFLTDDSAV